MLEVAGWIIWCLVVGLAIYFGYGCRYNERTGMGFTFVIGMQTFFLWLLAFLFLIFGWNKLHILWAIPIMFIFAHFIHLFNIPFITPIIEFLTSAFLKIILLGLKKKNHDNSTQTKLKVPAKQKDNTNISFEIMNIDNKSIETIKIRDQVWMAKNLDVAQYRNGDPIPQIEDPMKWKDLKTKWDDYDPDEIPETKEDLDKLDEYLFGIDGAWCYYNNDSGNNEKYGKLYNWDCIKDSRGLAPVGWRIPTESDFEILVKSLNNKKCGFTNYLPGERHSYGNFHGINENAYFWSSTIVSGFMEQRVIVLYQFGNDTVGISEEDMYNAYSIRCIRE